MKRVLITLSMFVALASCSNSAEGTLNNETTTTDSSTVLVSDSVSVDSTSTDSVSAE